MFFGYSSNVDRRALPVLLASARSVGDDESQPLDRLRMQKGVFLVTQRGPEAWRPLYRFSPYNWGPYSSDLASDLTALVFPESLLATDTSGKYPAYRTTERGEAWLELQISTAPTAYQDFVRSIRKFVTTRTFSQLLRDVYSAYPAYATRSRFSG